MFIEAAPFMNIYLVPDDFTQVEGLDVKVHKTDISALQTFSLVLYDKYNVTQKSSVPRSNLSFAFKRFL